MMSSRSSSNIRIKPGSTSIQEQETSRLSLNRPFISSNLRENKSLDQLRKKPGATSPKAFTSIEILLKEKTQEFSIKKLLQLNRRCPVELVHAFLCMMKPFNPEKDNSRLTTIEQFKIYLKSPGSTVKTIRSLPSLIKKTIYTSKEFRSITKNLERVWEPDIKKYEGVLELYHILKLTIELSSKGQKRTIKTPKATRPSTPGLLAPTSRLGPFCYQNTERSVSPISFVNLSNISYQHIKSTQNKECWEEERLKKRNLGIEARENFMEESLYERSQQERSNRLEEIEKKEELVYLHQMNEEKIREVRRLKIIQEEENREMEVDEYERNRMKSELVKGEKEIENRLLRKSTRTLLTSNNEDVYFRTVVRNPHKII